MHVQLADFFYKKKLNSFSNKTQIQLEMFHVGRSIEKICSAKRL